MTQWDVLPGEEPRRLAVEEPRHAPPGQMETRDAGDARPRFHSAPPSAAAGFQAPRGHGSGPRANEQGTQTPGRTVLRIQGVDPGMSPLECLARVWHYRGLRAVNPPQPAEGADDPPSVFLLFETAADARAAERAVGALFYDTNAVASELADPIGDEARSPVKGLVHRYPDRVLLKPLHVCPVYCRFCFRREKVGPGGEALSAAEREVVGARQRAAYGAPLGALTEVWEGVTGRPFKERLAALVAAV